MRLQPVVAIAARKGFVPSETITDRVTHVRDGDTIVVGDQPIRLDALN